MEKLTRTIELEIRAADDKARTIPAVVSTNTPVDRGGWTEILSHKKSAVDLSRAPIPLLTGHDTRSVNIGLVEKLHLDGNKLRGTVRLGHSKEADNIWPDIQSGVVRGLSVGYTVDTWEPGDDENTEIAVRWQPHELSIIGVGLDPNAGFNRSLTRENTMPDENTEKTNVTPPHERWLKQEKARREEIRTLFQMHRGVDDLMDDCLDDPAITADVASKRLLRALGERSSESLAGDYRQAGGGSMSVRDMADTGRTAYGDWTAKDTLGEFADAATDGILQRGGIKLEKPHVAAADCSRMRMSDIAETMLRQFSVRTSGMSRDQLIRKALSTRGLIGTSSSDFPALLENIATKALNAGFVETPAIYREIARTGSLPDFKEASRVALSDFSDLEIVYENGEYKYGQFSDFKETLQLVTYGKMFNISRQALVNDDLGALTNIPRGMAQAAARVIDDQVVSVLTTNAVLNQDSTALFHANHSNLVAPGSGSAPSVTSLDAGFVAMATQTGPQGSILDITPALLIVPVALDATARTLINAVNDPAGTTIAEPNPFSGRLKVISTARLDADDPLQWYLSADPRVVDTIEVAFLDGQEAPFLESKDGWSQDGIEYKVRMDCVAGALDFRGLYQNDGN